MQMLDYDSLLALSSCNRRLRGDAESRFALATQKQFSIASRLLAPDGAVQSPGLLQYHSNLHIWGPWKTLKRVPYIVLRNTVNLDIRCPLGFAKGLEEVLASTSRLRKLYIFGRITKNSTAVRLFRALGERERVEGASGLRTLHLEKETFGKEATYALSTYLASATSLEELTLYYCNFKKSYLQNLADGIVENRTIKSLSLNGSNLGLHSEVALSKILRGCPTLIDLNLCGTTFGSGDQHGKFATLTAAIMDDNCNLKFLNVVDNMIDSNGAIALAPTISKLHELETHCNKIWNAGIIAFGAAIKASKTITKIALSNNHGVAHEIEAFSLDLTVNKSLQVIELYGCKIGTPGLLHLKAALVGKSELRELHLFGNNIDDVGCQHVAEILASCPSLKVLHLGQNRIGNAGIRTIAAALSQARNLHKLVLYRNEPVDDPSAAALFTAVHGHPNLSRIIISSRNNNGFQIGELTTPILETLKPGLALILG
jgi:Ran GTPase-activating protein (RanGAP) involved in mRNA processing and transport